MDKRNQIVDILKLIFVFVIFINHLNSIAIPGEKINLIMHLGFLGVEFFFIVSGYLMFVKVDKSDCLNIGVETVQFIFRKISIFFPYYIIAYIIGFVVLHHSTENTLKMVIKDMILSFYSILQLQMAGFKSYQVLGPTWYLSSMVLCMMVLYPLALKYKKNFITLIAPVIAIVSYGYLSLNIGKLATINYICGGVVYSGILRGLGGISLGCICWGMAKKLKKCKFTDTGKCLITFIEILLYITVWSAMNWKIDTRLDFIIVLILLMAVSVSFSGQSFTSRLVRGEIKWIGSFSLSVYLADTIARNFVIILLPNTNRNDKILPCFIALIIFALIIKVFGDWIKVFYPKVKDRVVNCLFIKN